MPPHLRQGNDIVPDLGDQAAPRSSAGPLVGTIIIVVLLFLGALYFWGAELNKRSNVDQLPLISGDATTTIR